MSELMWFWLIQYNLCENKNMAHIQSHLCCKLVKRTYNAFALNLLNVQEKQNIPTFWMETKKK